MTSRPDHSARRLTLPVWAGSGFLRSYSGTLYLLEALQARGIDPVVYTADAASMAGEYAALPFPCRLLPERTDLRSLSQLARNRLFRGRMLADALRHPALLVTEYRFLGEARLYKTLRPSGYLVQFCQELVLPGEYPDSAEARRYGRVARRADLVLDVEPMRARIRREHFDLPREPLVLANTLPVARIPAPAPPGSLATLAGMEWPKDLPVLLVTGGAGPEKPLERVIDAVALATPSVFLLAFCSASPARLEELRAHAARRLGPGRCLIRGSVPRDRLLACTGEADIACVDYSTSVQNSSNQRYCAPTKLYEYMACGLAVAGSENESLRRVIEGEGIGCCAADGSVEALAAALSRLAGDPAFRSEAKARGPALFRDRYCYERCCEPVVDRIAGTLKPVLARR